MDGLGLPVCGCQYSESASSTLRCGQQRCRSGQSAARRSATLRQSSRPPSSMCWQTMTNLPLRPGGRAQKLPTQAAPAGHQPIGVCSTIASLLDTDGRDRRAQLGRYGTGLRCPGRLPRATSRGGCSWSASTSCRRSSAQRQRLNDSITCMLATAQLEPSLLMGARDIDLQAPAQLGLSRPMWSDHDADLSRCICTTRHRRRSPGSRDRTSIACMAIDLGRSPDPLRRPVRACRP